MQAPFLDLYRAGVRSMVDVMNTSLENTQRLQKQQLDMVRSALEENSRSTGELGEASSLQDLMAINSRLVGAQLDRMTEIWTGMWRMAGDAQKSMIDRVQSQIEQTAEAAGQAYEVRERGSADATELAASQLAAAVGQARRRSA